MINEILTQIVDWSELVQLSACWRFVAQSRSVRVSPFSAEELQEKLETRFTTQQLDDTKLFRRVNGRAVQSAVLSRGRPFIVVRHDKDSPPFDFISQAGSLTGKIPLLTARERDYFTLERAKRWKTIFVPFGSIDAALLRLLNLPVIPAAGLAHMSGEQARLLFKSQLKLRGPNPLMSVPTGKSLPAFHITFVGWSPFAISATLPPNAAGVLQQVRSAEEQLDIPGNLSPISVWTPTPQEIGSISAATRLKDSELVRRAFSRSLESSTCRLDQFFDSRSLADADFVAARSRLRSSLHRIGEVALPSQAISRDIAAVDAAFKNQVITPMLRSPDYGQDPLRKLVLLQATELAQQLHDSSTLMVSARMAAAGRAFASDGRLESEDINARIRISKLLLELVRHLKSYH